MKAAWHYSLAVLALFCLWQAGAMALGPHLLPQPLPVLRAFVAALSEGEFWKHALASSFRVTAAMVLAMAVAYPLGLLLGRARRLDAYLAPLIFLTYPLPKIVLLPIFFILFGLGDLSRVLLVALTVGYQILVVTRAAAQGVDRKYFDAFRTLGGSSRQMLRHVLIPATLPHAVTALKVAGGTAVAVLFMAESFATRSGLGFLIMDAWGMGNQEDMFVGILGMSVLGLAVYECGNGLEWLFCRWKRHHTTR